MLREALGAKKLKELRRQRNRLAEHGEVSFHVARTPNEVAAAAEIFLELEASGWKARRGTALLQDVGDAAFIRRATVGLAETGNCEIVTLRAGEMPVAAGVVLRHQDRAFFFKLGVDERFAKLSPGVQLTLDLTRHLCADPAIATADSTAAPDHPMINPIWRGRLAIGDVLIPLRRRDPVVPLVRASLALRKTDPRARTLRGEFHPEAKGRTSGEIPVNTSTAVAPVITAANESLRRDFPLKPFAIRHKLSGHPLLMLPRIAQLAAELPRDLIEYNSGKVAISQDPDAIPSVDLDPVEVVKSIETAGAWMVLKRVENSPEYRQLLEDTLLSVARARGFNSLLDAGFEQLEGFLFVSSPNSTTPFHLDSEDNFFVHIHGEKFFTIFDNTDRAIVDDDEIERSMTKHRNLKYDEQLCRARPGIPSVRRRRLLRALSVAALGAHRQFLFDLDGDHLEDPRGAPPQRFALLQLDAARHRLSAEAAGRAARARCAKTCLLPHRDDGNQTAARLDGDAQGAAPDRARQEGELLFEGRVASTSPDAAQRVLRCEPGPSSAQEWVPALRCTATRCTASGTRRPHCNGECGAGSMMVECISSRKPGPLVRNSCHAGSFIAPPRAAARALRSG